MHSLHKPRVKGLNCDVDILNAGRNNHKKDADHSAKKKQSYIPQT